MFNVAISKVGSPTIYDTPRRYVILQPQEMPKIPSLFHFRRCPARVRRALTARPSGAARIGIPARFGGGAHVATDWGSYEHTDNAMRLA